MNHYKIIASPDPRLYEKVEVVPPSGMELDTQTILDLGLESSELLQAVGTPKTDLGAYLLGFWLKSPLTDLHRINERLDVVEALVGNSSLRSKLQEQLSRMNHITKELYLNFTRGVTVRWDWLMRDTRTMLEAISAIHAQLRQADDHIFLRFEDVFSAAAEAGHPSQLYELFLDTQPGKLEGEFSLKEGQKVIYHFTQGGTNTIEDLAPIVAKKAKEERVFGERRSLHLIDVGSWATHAERFQTESFLLALRTHRDILMVCHLLAELDILCAFAEKAEQHGWTRPILADSDEQVLEIEGGKHPVYSQGIPNYVGNNFSFGSSSPGKVILGPNMSGKSFCCATASLIVALAQCGSFVPAKKARIGLVDQIFARGRVKEDVKKGLSLFGHQIVLAKEALEQATPRTLVWFDELGTATRVRPGIALAAAIIKALIQKGVRVLLSTNFTDLPPLLAKAPGIALYHMSFEVDETTGWVESFDFKLVEGIRPAPDALAMALTLGLADEIIERAKKLRSSPKQ